MVNNVGYTDEELRFGLLPHVIKLLDNDFYRASQKTNTDTMAAVTSELLNIVKYGTVKAPDDTATTEPQIVNAEPVAEAKFA